VDEFPMPVSICTVFGVFSVPLTLFQLNQLGSLHSLAVSTDCQSKQLPKSLYHALMNNSATSLSRIYIESGVNTISGLLAVYWPQLRHFTATLVSTTAEFVIPENFLQLHVNLKTLRIIHGSIRKLVALPRLQSLCVTNIFQQDYNLLPNIRHLSAHHAYDRYDKPYCLDSLRELPFLESFLAPTYFSSADVALFLNKAPNIKRLSVNLPHEGPRTKKSKQKVYPHEIYVNRYSDLNFLIYFSGNESCE
jgi:hypothetical protein